MVLNWHWLLIGIVSIGVGVACLMGLLASGGVCIWVITTIQKVIEDKIGLTQKRQLELDSYLKKKVPLFKQTEKTAIEIVSNVTTEPLPLTASKFGGIPYFPKFKPYPLDYAGDKMCFLAQINLADVPKTDLLPESGLLQFFIHGPDPAWPEGPSELDFGQLAHVEYIPRPTEKDLITDPSFFPHLTHPKDFILRGEYKLDFNLHKEVISFSDYRFEKAIQSSTLMEKVGGDEEAISKSTGLRMHESGHKLFGYPRFCQWDVRHDKKIRAMEKPGDEFILLFQVDSEFEGTGDIMWGDLGVGNFFIRPSDLTSLDFSKVLYSWDCS